MNNYQGYEGWKLWDAASFGTWSASDANYFAAELSRAGIESCKDLSIFEIGFGNGAFGAYVKTMGGKYVGSEINGALVDRASAFGLEVFAGDMGDLLTRIKGGRIDAVVAFDVLEHFELEAIRLFLLDAYQLLRPGGVVLARVPSGDSPFGRAVFHGDITHRTALGSSAVRQLALQAQFHVIDIGPPRLPILGLGLVRAIRRAFIRSAQCAIAGLINLVFHDGQPLVITPNLVFVLKKIAK